MPIIQNVSRHDVEVGRHHIPGENGAILIQISDPDTAHPVPKHVFKKTYQFKFLDIEDDQVCLKEEWRPSQDDAYDIVMALEKALDAGMDVIVHCHMGVCRSGAVAEAGAILGFQCLQRPHSPNSSLKRRLLEALDLSFDPSRSAFNE